MRERKFTAPQLEYFVSSSRHCINRNPKACTPATAEALEELFVEVRKLSPVFENGGRTIYCLVDRGPIEDWADYEDYLADEIVTNYAEFEEAWKRNYPYEKQWFEFSFLEDDSNGYKGIWVNNQLTINTMPNPFMNNDIIDEPELGLHPQAINKLSALIKKTIDKSQIIISTQSVNLVDNFEPDDIIVVDMKEGASDFHRLDGKKLEVWLDEYSLGEVWEKNVIGGQPF